MTSRIQYGANRPYWAAVRDDGFPITDPHRVCPGTTTRINPRESLLLTPPQSAEPHSLRTERSPVRPGPSARTASSDAAPRSIPAAGRHRHIRTEKQREHSSRPEFLRLENSILLPDSHR